MSDGSANAWLQDRQEGDAYRRVEVITGRRRRRTWSAEEKARLVALANEPGATVTEVARRAGVNRTLLNEWRRAFAEARASEACFVPVEADAPAAARQAAAMRREEAVIEVDVALGRLVIRGAADPALAIAVVGALRSRA